MFTIWRVWARPTTRAVSNKSRLDNLFLKPCLLSKICTEKSRKANLIIAQQFHRLSKLKKNIDSVTEMVYIPLRFGII